MNGNEDVSIYIKELIYYKRGEGCMIITCYIGCAKNNLYSLLAPLFKYINVKHLASSRNVKICEKAEMEIRSFSLNG